MAWVEEGKTRHCPRCNEVLPVSKFYLRNSGYYDSYCDKCKLEYAAEYAARKKGK